MGHLPGDRWRGAGRTLKSLIKIAGGKTMNEEEIELIAMIRHAEDPGKAAKELVNLALRILQNRQQQTSAVPFLQEIAS